MENYETKLAAAYVRGILDVNQFDLDDLNEYEMDELILKGKEMGLKMYHFKKKELLPRVKMVMGILKGVQPENLLDVGSGRGVFLFPFLNEFFWVPVTSVDILEHRVEMLQKISAGGMSNLTALQQDICKWSMEDNSFDVVTLLEVLEHIPDVQAAVNAAVRLAKRYVVVSVPSKPDDNPEHIHLLTKEVLTELFNSAGCEKLQFSGVNGHLIMTAKID